MQKLFFCIKKLLYYYKITKNLLFSKVFILLYYYILLLYHSKIVIRYLHDIIHNLNKKRYYLKLYVFKKITTILLLCIQTLVLQRLSFIVIYTVKNYYNFLNLKKCRILAIIQQNEKLLQIKDNTPPLLFQEDVGRYD